MSKSDHWMPWYIGDYFADTRHLSCTEHGAYLQLLAHQWRVGYVPDDETLMARIVGLRMDKWRAISATMRSFFHVSEPGQLRQKRLHQERLKALKVSEKRSEAAKASRRSATSAVQNPPAQQDTNSGPKLLINNEPEEANAGRLLAFCTTQPQPQPQPQLEKKDIPVATLPPSPAMPARRRDLKGLQAGFVEFWRYYPRKVGKGDAEKAWPKAVEAAGGDPEDVVIGLKARLHLFDTREEMRFVPHPATWLRQKRWLDGEDAEEPEPARSTSAPQLALH